MPSSRANRRRFSIHRQAPVERGLLRDPADLAGRAADRSAVGLPDPGKDREQRRLAGAVRADDRQQLAPMRLEAEPLQRLPVAEPLGEPARLDHDLSVGAGRSRPGTLVGGRAKASQASSSVARVGGWKAMATASSRLAEQGSGGTAGRRLSDRRRLIRQASAWLPKRRPQPTRLQDLERSEAIRWVDLYGGALRDSEAHALLDPVCRGELGPRMVRDLVTPGRYPATRSYGVGSISITAAFRARHLRPGTNLTSVFEPVHLLPGMAGS